MIRLGSPFGWASIGYRMGINTLSMYRDRDRDLYTDGDKTEKNTKTEKKTFYAKTQKLAGWAQKGLLACESLSSRLHGTFLEATRGRA